MKKLLTLAFVLCFAFMASAQVEQGKWLFGAQSDMNLLLGSSETEYEYTGGSETEDGPTTTNINISPKAGYFFIDGLAGGLFVDFTSTTEKYETEVTTISGSEKTVDEKYSESMFLVGPFLRYYFNMEKIKPFLGAEIGLGSYSYKDEEYDYDEDKIVEYESDPTSLFGVGFGGGVAFFLSPNVSLDAMISYEMITAKYEVDNGDDKTDVTERMNQFGVNIGFSIFLP